MSQETRDEGEKLVSNSSLLNDTGNVDDDEGQKQEIFQNLWQIEDGKLLGGVKQGSVF